MALTKQHFAAKTKTLKSILNLTGNFLAIFLLISNVNAVQDKPEELVLGIDLGTTYSCVGIFKNGQVQIIPNEQGNRITPSYVAFTDIQDGDGGLVSAERLIGDAAKAQLSSNPSNTLFDAKRFIGREWTEPFVQANRGLYPFAILERNGKPYFEIQTQSLRRTLSPEEVSAMVLVKLKESAEAYLGVPVTKAVITVPAYFNDAQRSATRDAGTIAGLTVLRIINEPTAAAVAYGYGLVESKEGSESVPPSGWTSFFQRFNFFSSGNDEMGNAKIVLVYDLGGGTFDVSLLSIERGLVEVLATNGITELGGQDFDARVMNHFIGEYKEMHGLNLTSEPRSLQKLRREVEKAKRSLSTYDIARLEIEDFHKGEDFSATLTRKKFERLNKDLFESTLGPVRKVLSDTGIKVDEVDEIVLVGGSTRIPRIRELVKIEFKGKEPRKDINADEAVAYGAAIQAGILGGSNKANLLLLDINPLTLGIENSDKSMSVIIKRNTPIPCSNFEMYTTASDNQDSVDIQVYEGERTLTADNHLLGKFNLDGITPAPRGEPEIKVTFTIDANGILEVTAKNIETGHAETRTIANDHNRLKSSEIDAMVADSVKFSKQDAKIRQRLAARAELESYIYTLRSMIRDESGLGGQLSEEMKTAFEEVIQDVIKWLDNNINASKYEYKNLQSEIVAKIERVVESFEFKGKERLLNSTFHRRNKL